MRKKTPTGEYLQSVQSQATVKLCHSLDDDSPWYYPQWLTGRKTPSYLLTYLDEEEKHKNEKKKNNIRQSIQNQAKVKLCHSVDKDSPWYIRNVWLGIKTPSYLLTYLTLIRKKSTRTRRRRRRRRRGRSKKWGWTRAERTRKGGIRRPTLKTKRTKRWKERWFRRSLY